MRDLDDFNDDLTRPPDDFNDDLTRPPDNFNDDLTRPPTTPVSLHPDATHSGWREPPDDFNDATEGIQEAPLPTPSPRASTAELIRAMQANAPNLTISWEPPPLGVEPATPQPFRGTRPRRALLFGVAAIALMAALTVSLTAGSYLYEAARDLLGPSEVTESSESLGETPLITTRPGTHWAW